MKYITIINGEEFEIHIDKNGNLRVNGEPREVDFRPLGPSLYSIIMDNRSFQLVIDEDRGECSVLMAGRLFSGQVLDERAMLMAQRRDGLGPASGELKAPMPGLIVGIPVMVGQQVEKGETCVVLESMKMQNELKAPISGEVRSIAARVGDTVDKEQPLMVIVVPVPEGGQP